jgi:hypothetical protein
MVVVIVVKVRVVGGRGMVAVFGVRSRSVVVVITMPIIIY